MEEHLGPETVREHRASIELSGELASDSPATKSRKRRCAMRQRRVDASLATACGLVIATGLYFAFEQLLRVFLCPATSDDVDAAGAFCNCTSANASAAGGCLPPLLADAPLQMIGLLPAGLAALAPAVRFLYEHFTRVRPYLRHSRGEMLFQEAKVSSGRADMTESLGFMGKVRMEVEYLYDLLRTEQYHDKNLGCQRRLRLCVMIDDLDRCPKDAIVKVLEATILLLVNAPITCWLAIDSRVVVSAIEDQYDLIKSDISGHEFLDKIVQMPFCLPNLELRKKQDYLSKIVERGELDQKRVLVRVEHELQEAGLYVPTVASDPTISCEYPYNQLQEYRLQALVSAAQAMRAANMLTEDPRRRDKMRISEEGLIEQIEKNGNWAFDAQKENFLAMMSEDVKRLAGLRLHQANYEVRYAEPEFKVSDVMSADELEADRSASSRIESDATAAVE